MLFRVVSVVLAVTLALVFVESVHSQSYLDAAIKTKKKPPAATTSKTGSLAPNTVAVVGTGNMGSAIAELFCKSGIRVLLASRSMSKASSKAQTIMSRFQCSITAVPNMAAVRQAGTVILTLPFPTVPGWLEANRDEIIKRGEDLLLVDITNPWRSANGIAPDAAHLSALEKHIAALNNPPTRFVAAFKNNFAMKRLQHKSGRNEVEFVADSQDTQARFERLVGATRFKPVFRGLVADGAAALLEAEVRVSKQCQCHYRLCRPMTATDALCLPDWFGLSTGRPISTGSQGKVWQVSFRCQAPVFVGTVRLIECGQSCRCSRSHCSCNWSYIMRENKNYF